MKENIIQIYNLDNGKSQIIKGENDIIFQITNEKNELELLKNGSLNNYDLSIIELGKCETELREKNNIDDEQVLIYLKQEITNSKTSEKNITYEVYEPINYTKLNLSICDNIPINIYVSLNLSEETNDIYEKIKELGYNMFNIDDPFYRDICTPYKSAFETDMLTDDRINYIYYNEDSECQENCEFTNYIANTGYINCTCNSQESTKVEKINLMKENFI